MLKVNQMFELKKLESFMDATIDLSESVLDLSDNLPDKVISRLCHCIFHWTVYNLVNILSAYFFQSLS